MSECQISAKATRNGKTIMTVTGTEPGKVEFEWAEGAECPACGSEAISLDLKDCGFPLPEFATLVCWECGQETRVEIDG